MLYSFSENSATCLMAYLLTFCRMDEIRPLVSDVNGIVTQVSKERFVGEFSLWQLIMQWIVWQ